jgi:hypothetical protein
MLVLHSSIKIHSNLYFRSDTRQEFLFHQLLYRVQSNYRHMVHLLYIREGQLLTVLVFPIDKLLEQPK